MYHYTTVGIICYQTLCKNYLHFLGSRVLNILDLTILIWLGIIACMHNKTVSDLALTIIS